MPPFPLSTFESLHHHPEDVRPYLDPQSPQSASFGDTYFEAVDNLGLDLFDDLQEILYEQWATNLETCVKVQEAYGENSEALEEEVEEMAEVVSEDEWVEGDVPRPLFEGRRKLSYALERKRRSRIFSDGLETPETPETPKVARVGQDDGSLEVPKTPRLFSGKRALSYDLKGNSSSDGTLTPSASSSTFDDSPLTDNTSWSAGPSPSTASFGEEISPPELPPKNPLRLSISNRSMFPARRSSLQSTVQHHLHRQLSNRACSTPNSPRLPIIAKETPKQRSTWMATPKLPVMLEQESSEEDSPERASHLSATRKFSFNTVDEGDETFSETTGIKRTELFTATHQNVDRNFMLEVPKVRAKSAMGLQRVPLMMDLTLHHETPTKRVSMPINTIPEAMENNLEGESLANKANSDITTHKRTSSEDSVRYPISTVNHSFLHTETRSSRLFAQLRDAKAAVSLKRSRSTSLPATTTPPKDNSSYIPFSAPWSPPSYKSMRLRPQSCLDPHHFRNDVDPMKERLHTIADQIIERPQNIDNNVLLSGSDRSMGESPQNVLTAFDQYCKNQYDLLEVEPKRIVSMFEPWGSDTEMNDAPTMELTRKQKPVLSVQIPRSHQNVDLSIKWAPTPEDMETSDIFETISHTSTSVTTSEKPSSTTHTKPLVPRKKNPFHRIASKALNRTSSMLKKKEELTAGEIACLYLLPAKGIDTTGGRTSSISTTASESAAPLLRRSSSASYLPTLHESSISPSPANPASTRSRRSSIMSLLRPTDLQEENIKVLPTDLNRDSLLWTSDNSPTPVNEEYRPHSYVTASEESWLPLPHTRKSGGVDKERSGIDMKRDDIEKPFRLLGMEEPVFERREKRKRRKGLDGLTARFNDNFHLG